MDSNNNGLVINCDNGHVHVYLHSGHVMPRDTEHVPQTDGIACLSGAGGAPEHGDLLITRPGASKHDSYVRKLDTMR